MFNPLKIIDWIGDVTKSLSVPSHSEDPTTWRRAVRAFIILLTVGLSLHVLWSAGLLRVGEYGFIGPARAAEKAIEAKLKPLQESVDSTQQGMRAILRALYNERIREKVRHRCDTDDPERRADINRQLDSLKREFKTLSGEDYGDEPTCEQV